eukprot:TRINITY_DN1689_c0_g3_i4.p1 TRINITY_DN1689_c0_g3~~TRINITY_DN1689_c0_g3_i4.p1  ORF type:complete len:103 (+),score=15.38 TRINITY_DN1689_c0_g3_i4:107-415(+)
MPQLDEHGLPPASGENEPCVEDMEESDDEVDENEKDEFYDDKVDQMDEAWVRKNRATAGHQSDATLNCPCCLTTLCYDCQKHAKYHTPVSYTHLTLPTKRIV